MAARGERILSVTINDCDVQTFRAGGKGGQNQNKRETGCRIIHPPSGAVGESREQRSQLQNKRAAWMRLVQSPKFQAWMRRATGKAALAEVQVERDMASANLRIEGKSSGKWVEIG